MKRALILAGGGIKVAFQAGVLQVWLDEAGLEFDLADGASGGTFNLAMWCQGMNGTQIADNWRHMSADAGVDPNWQEYPKLFMAESLMPHWMRVVASANPVNWALEAGRSAMSANPDWARVAIQGGGLALLAIAVTALSVLMFRAYQKSV